MPAAPSQLPGLEESTPARPFLRWAGGKTRLLKHLKPFFPDTFQSYYEPFLGGGAVFFSHGFRASGRRVLADLNAELVNTWLAIRDQPDDFLLALEDYYGKDSGEAYYEVRSADWPDDRVLRAARFLYLNQTAWNGLWRVNRWGGFNVPWGDRPFRGMAPEEVNELNGLLDGVDLQIADFRDVLSEPEAGDFVYLDPPYLPLSDTSKFYLYNEKRFRLPDLEELAECCEQLTSRGVYWMLSNRDTPEVRRLFSHAAIHALTTRRSVAAQTRRNVEAANSPEVIIVGAPV